jgi:lipopolysaccharide export LptBFGC system permease protein LptF
MGRSYPVIWVVVAVVLLFVSQLYGSQLSCYMGHSYLVIWVMVAVVLLIGSRLSCYMGRSCMDHSCHAICVTVILFYGLRS